MFSTKKVLVVGAAKSGISAASLLLKLGAKVTLTDIKPFDSMDLEDQRALSALDIELVTGAHPLELLDGIDLIVKNPGIPPTLPLFKEARARKILWISELELAGLVTRAEVVAITGTNGKTTTTALTGALLSMGPRPVVVGGNIGTPLTAISYDKGPEWLLVVESSSFQLEDCYEFKPHIAIYTNITPDHLDRHGSMDSYIAAKARIQQNQGEADFVVANLDDPVVSNLPGGNAQRLGYSLTPRPDAVCFIDQGWFCWRREQDVERIAPVTDLQIPGTHNQQNALAAISAAKILGLDNQLISLGLQDFCGVEHRLEFAGEAGGVRFYNDSKATNPVSTETALRAFAQKVILLAGGYDKGADFLGLAHLFPEKLKLLVTFGPTGPQIDAAAKSAGFNALEQASDLAQAFELAVARAQAGDVVLLSPACASWDAFRDFEERGQLFKALVLKLGG